MRGFSAIDSRDPAAPALALEPPPATLAGGLPAARHWPFSRDLRAAGQVCIFAADVFAVAVAGVAGFLIWNGELGLPSQYWGHIAVGCVTFVLVMQIAGMYRFAALRRHGEHLVRLTGLWATVVLLLMAIIYLARRSDEYSRAWMLLWGFSGWCALIATRILAWQTIRRLRGELVTRVAVVGHRMTAQRCAQRLRDDGDGDVEIVGVFETRDSLGQRGAENGRDEGVFARLRAADTQIDEVVFAMPCIEVQDLDAAVLGRSNPRPVDIKIGYHIGAAHGSGGGALVLIPLWQRPLAGLPAILKRAIDACASAILLVSILPLLAAIAALIKLDSRGPVLFRQQRFGINKKPFELYKFRSMHCEAGGDPSVPQARRHDPRVTRFGRFLRRTSLDELPQLLNVLKGDMSLVGPRPHATLHDEKYAELIEGYSARHHVKPGITGWAQVHGWRGETDTLEKMERRVECDIYYIDHWSMLLDFRILFRTLVVVFGQRNAY
jgi:Undecaprenyl-phosphate glucose phosphotransferase